MSVSAVLGPQLVAMGVAVKKPSATASFGVPKTSPWRGSVGGGFEYEEKGNRYFMRKLKKVKKSNGQVLSINEGGRSKEKELEKSIQEPPV